METAKPEVIAGPTDLNGDLNQLICVCFQLCEVAYMCVGIYMCVHSTWRPEENLICLKSMSSASCGEQGVDTLVHNLI